MADGQEKISNRGTKGKGAIPVWPVRPPPHGHDFHKPTRHRTIFEEKAGFEMIGAGRKPRRFVPYICPDGGLM